MTKKKLLNIMFETFDCLHEDMEVFAAMWEGLMSEFGFRFVDKIKSESLQEYCNEHFAGDVSDCFYDYINSEAVNTPERFELFAAPFIEEIKLAETPSLLPLFGAIVNPHNSAA